MEAIKYKPSAYWALDDTTPFQDYSGYARSGVLTGTEKKGIALFRDSTYSQVLQSDTTATFASTAYVAGKEADPFSLSAIVRPVFRSAGQSSQAYLENLAGNPSFNIAQTPRILAANGSLTHTNNNVKITAGGVSLNYAYAHSASGTPASRINGVTAGDRVGFAYKVTALRDMTIVASVGAYDISGAGAVGTSFTYVNPSARTYNLLAGETKWVGTIAQFNDTGGSNMAGMLPLIYFYPYGTTTGFLTAGDTANISSVTVVNYGKNSSRTTQPDFHFDGTMPGYEWSGTAHSSISRTMPNVSRVNLATNPGGEVVGGWNSNNGTNYPVTRDTTIFRSGTASYKSTVAVAQNSVASIYALGTFGNAKYAVTPGEQVTLSVWMRAGQANCQGNVNLIGYDNNAVPTTTLGSTPIPTPAGVWTLVRNTFTIPANTFQVYTMCGMNRVSNGTAAIGEYGHFDDVVFERGAPSAQTFNGDTAGAGWTGTANQSASVMYVSNSEQQILSNQGKYDGLTINGTVVSFSTKYVNTGEAKCSYDMQIPQLVELVGVHTKVKNSLYVNGELVSEVAITPEQQADVYDAPNSNLYSGLTTGSQAVMVNGIGIYNTVLLSNQVANMYVSNQIRTTANIPKMFGGEVIKVSSDIRPVAVKGVWNTTEDWQNAQLVSAIVENSQVVPSMVNGTSLAGTWTDSISLYSGGVATTINTANMNWIGENVTIEVSIDGTTWETVSRTAPISLLTGLNPTNKELYIRATFAAGVTNAYLDTLRFSAYTSTTVTPPDGRSIAFPPTSVTMDEYEPMTLRDDWGTLVSSGNIVIGADTTDEPLVARTMEFWVKRLDETIPFRSFAASGLYVNAVNMTVPPVGEWALVHVVCSADQTTFAYGGNIQVGRIAYYPTALSVPEMQKIYALYTGNNYMPVDDGADIVVSEPATPAIIYAHDWEITAS